VVGAIVLFTDPFFRVFKRRAAPDPFLPQTLVRGPRRWVHSSYEWVSGGVSVSLAAWIGSLPLVLWYFHLVTPISLLANLAVVPIAFFVLAVALVSLLVTPLFPWIAVIFNNANWTLATLVIGIVDLFAQIPGGHFYVAPLNWNEKTSARMTVLDLGPGAAVHLRTVGSNWLFDCGSERNYGRVVREYLHWTGVNRLSGLFLSHGDSLHIGGAMELLNDFPNTQVFDNPAPDRSALHRRLSRMLSELKKRGLKRSSLIAGDDLRLSRDVSARVLFPPSSFAGTTADHQAFVIRLSIAPATFVLLMSDSGTETEQALLSDSLELHSDVLIKGQHHSAASGSGPFLDAVRPRLIIATSQDFPASERISEDWVEEVRARGIKLFRQDETGAVELKFSGKEWTARAYLTGEIFRSVSR
jgi:beta-lactamase superfamily II metal-dependent hydrolase